MVASTGGGSPTPQNGLRAVDVRERIAALEQSIAKLELELIQARQEYRAVVPVRYVVWLTDRNATLKRTNPSWKVTPVWHLTTDETTTLCRLPINDDTAEFRAVKIGPVCRNCEKARERL